MGTVTTIGWVGLLLGPLLTAAVYLLMPEAGKAGTEGLTPAGRATAAVAAWMACWWLTEAAPLAATALMLGIAYAASIGGVGTLIGTPPNLVLAAFVEARYGVDITMADWLKVGLPVVFVMLPLTWWYLTRLVCPVRLGSIEGGRDLIVAELHKLGPMTRGEWTVLTVFLLTTTLMPVLAATAAVLGMEPGVVLTAATLAASCAFMLPVAAPPNAIVFSSGYVNIAQMVKAGFGLNILSVLVISLLVSYTGISASQ